MSESPLPSKTCHCEEARRSNLPSDIRVPPPNKTCHCEEARRSNLPSNFRVSPPNKTCHCEEVRRSNLLHFAGFSSLKLTLRVRINERNFVVNATDCFVVPPRNDTFVLGEGTRKMLGRLLRRASSQ